MEYHEGITSLILASLILVWRFRKEGKDLRIKAKNVVRSKTPMIDANYFIVSKNLTDKIVSKLVEITGAEGEKIPEGKKLTIKGDREEIREITEECREEFVRISWINVRLNEFPNEFTEIIDRMTKSLVFGFFGSILFLTLGHLEKNPTMFAGWGIFYFVYIVVLAFFSSLFLLYYFYAGIYQIIPQRKLGKKLDEIEECKDLDEIEECL